MRQKVWSLNMGSHYSVLSESVPGGAGWREWGGWHPGSGRPREAGKVEATSFVTLVSKRLGLGHSLFWDSDVYPTLAFQLL